MLHVRWHLFHEFFVRLFIFLPDTDVIMILLQYLFVALIIPFSYEDKHIELCAIDASIDQWHSRLKTRICAEGEHFKHMT